MKEEDRSRADWKQLDDKLKEVFGLSDEQLAEEYDFYAAASASEDMPPAPEGGFEQILRRLREKYGENGLEMIGSPDRESSAGIMRADANGEPLPKQNHAGESADGKREEIAGREEPGRASAGGVPGAKGAVQSYAGAQYGGSECSDSDHMEPKDTGRAAGELRQGGLHEETGSRQAVKSGRVDSGAADFDVAEMLKREESGTVNSGYAGVLKRKESGVADSDATEASKRVESRAMDLGATEVLKQAEARVMDFGAAEELKRTESEMADFDYAEKLKCAELGIADSDRTEALKLVESETAALGILRPVRLGSERMTHGTDAADAGEPSNMGSETRKPETLKKRGDLLDDAATGKAELPRSGITDSNSEIMTAGLVKEANESDGNAGENTAAETIVNETAAIGLDAAGHTGVKGGKEKTAPWKWKVGRRRKKADDVRAASSESEDMPGFNVISNDGEEVNIRKGRRFWRKTGAPAGGEKTPEAERQINGLWQWVGIAAVAVMLGTAFFSPGIQVIGSKMYEYVGVGRNGKESVVNNAEYLAIDEEMEQAYARIRDELGIRVIELSYMPEGMVFDNVSITRGIARMVFAYEDREVYFIQIIQVVDNSFDQISDRMQYNSVYNENLDEEISIYMNRLENDDIEFGTQIMNDKYYYFLAGIMEESEFIEIVKGMRYYGN